jgi:glycosyltransferase involved in cell wall biosynthesis
MKSPLVSIVIPTYNRRRWIGECLDAVRAQSYSNFEVLVIDDCSTDGTVEWLRSEPRYQFAKVHVQPKNAGASEARNSGVRMSSGDLITFIDSDDVLERTHLETAVSIFETYPNVGLFCCDSLTIGPEGELLHNGRTWHEVNSEIKNYPVRSGLRSLRDVFLFSNCFPGFTLRRDMFDTVGYLDQTIFPLDDYDLALRIAGRGFGIYYCHEPLARYRDHGGNASGLANSIKVSQEKLRCLRRALENYPELRSPARDVRKRFAEILVELAVAYVHNGNHKLGFRAIGKAVTSDPTRLVEIARLGGRRLRRWMASRQVRTTNGLNV